MRENKVINNHCKEIINKNKELQINLSKANNELSDIQKIIGNINEVMGCFKKNIGGRMMSISKINSYKTQANLFNTKKNKSITFKKRIPKRSKKIQRNKNSKEPEYKNLKKLKKIREPRLIIMLNSKGRIPLSFFVVF